MARKNQIVAPLLERWRQDLRELFSGVSTDPFAEGRGRRWDRDFSGEVAPRDVHYAIFIGVLSLIPALVAAYVSLEPQWKVMAQFFRAPIQVVVSGFITSGLIFLGAHFNKVPKSYAAAFKLMLRIMAIHPLLAFFQIFPYGEVLGLLVYGFFVVRGVRKTYSIPTRNVVLFFGTTYLVFALLTLKTIISPPASRDRLRQLQDSRLPPSKGMIRTSSSSSRPS